VRIAYICADLGIPVFGQKGCSIHVQEVIRALRHQGATVELFAVRCEGSPPADLADVKVHALPPISKGNPKEREEKAIALNDHLYEVLSAQAPFDLIYERYALWSCRAMEFAQQADIPGVLEVNAPLIEEQAQYRELYHLEAAEEMSARAFLSARQLIAVSQGVKDYLSLWVQPSKVHVIPNGVNHHRFYKETEPTVRFFPEDKEVFTVGFVGSLKPWHGLVHLVNAFVQLHQRVPEARLLVVGDGPERVAIEAMLARENLQSVVHFTGAVLPEEIPSLLGAMDTAVAPYPADLKFYFSPLKVVEYMAAGLPVVVSDLGQLSRLVEHGKTGLLCVPEDESAIADALERLWRSPELRVCLGRAAKQQILTHHTWDGVAKEILAIAMQKESLVVL